jgi:hypothetical protein
VPLNSAPFWLWRKRLHDAVDSRRDRNFCWEKFGLVARWDGCKHVSAVACLAGLGSRDLCGLIDCREVRALEQNDADTVAQVLLAAPVTSLQGSLKNIFLTINPRTGPRKIQPAPRDYEPMPFIF